MIRALRGGLLPSWNHRKAGYGAQLDAVGGGSWYWNNPYSTSWIKELEAGVHSLDIAIYGYSDGTMDHGRVSGQSLEVFPLS